MWVFIDANLYGPGYWVSTLGLIVIGIAIPGTLYDAVTRRRPKAVVPALRSVKA